MLDFVLRPIRSALGAGERQVTAPLEQTERQMVDAAQAIHRASDSIDRHVSVIEGLATSVGPLTESVNQLTKTMDDLVAMLGPLAGAERDVGRVEHLFGFRRHHDDAPSEPDSPES